MKTPLSNLTASNVLEYRAALGLNNIEFAQAVNKSPTTTSNYASGKRPVPESIARKMVELLDTKRSEFAKLRGRLATDISVGELIQIQNTVRQSRSQLHNTQGRLMRRQAAPDARTYPAYQLSLRQYKCYVAALKSWHTECKGRLAQYADELRIRDYQLELADLKVLAETAPRHTPYDVVLTHTEWNVVSRALIHHSKYANSYAYSLCCTWRKNRSIGSVLNRLRKQREQRTTAPN